MKTNNPSQSGFTLVEILAAMAIFAIIATLAVTGLQAIIKQYQYTKQVQLDLLNTQRIILKMTQDIWQIVYRARINSVGQTVPSFYLDKKGDSVEFISGNRQNWTRQLRANLFLVKYHLVGDELIRSHWIKLDGSNPDELKDRVWLKGVEEFNVVLQNAQNQSVTNLNKAHHLFITLQTTHLGQSFYVVPMPSYEPTI